jgi:hypothetical protein
MSDVIGVIREAILGTCGLGGMLKFNALYAGGFEIGDGEPDLPAINEAICKTFPPDQATGIMVAVTKKLGILPSLPVLEAAASAAESPQDNGPDGTVTLAKYFNADPNSVRDIVAEGRRMRLAMGKPIVEPPGQPAERPADTGVAAGKAATEAVAEKKTEKAVEILRTAPGGTTAGSPAVPKPAKMPGLTAVIKLRPVAEPVPEIDREIERFAYRQTAYTSIDIIDFIRYMKDKGYSFEESIVLEKIYVKIENRKKEARSTIEKEVEGIFDGARTPAEPDISRLIGRLRKNGLVFEEEDVRRLARVAALRRA